METTKQIYCERKGRNIFTLTAATAACVAEATPSTICLSEQHLRPTKLSSHATRKSIEIHRSRTGYSIGSEQGRSGPQRMGRLQPSNYRQVQRGWRLRVPLDRQRIETRKRNRYHGSGIARHDRDESLMVPGHRHIQRECSQGTGTMDEPRTV